MTVLGAKIVPAQIRMASLIECFNLEVTFSIIHLNYMRYSKSVGRPCLILPSFSLYHNDVAGQQGAIASVGIIMLFHISKFSSSLPTPLCPTMNNLCRFYLLTYRYASALSELLNYEYAKQWLMICLILKTQESYIWFIEWKAIRKLHLAFVINSSELLFYHILCIISNHVLLIEYISFLLYSLWYQDIFLSSS